MDVVDKDGIHGRVVANGPPTNGEEQWIVEVEDRSLLVPVHALEPRGDEYFLPVRFADIETAGEGSTITVPVMEERLRVEKRPYEERVTVEKWVESHDEWVDLPTEGEEIAIERVAVNQEVDTPVDAHYDGETLVIPLFEEVVVTEKRLVLREEVRITKHRSQRSRPEKVTLRREEVAVKRDKQQPH
ncbi:YsnF/AvaK domain-containing protein [Thiohalomonas denitrificans]|uniref:Conserved domain-containing protein n=1 Tax=Thiohalomonas denitrificans TaxID=415747 RepID=A0A1G5QLB7_9GAMM|nr:YsnF/AvaK domain-containing protein [Thiohalomonas denitrificans]SCZ62350.1 conserved domain-containing protein [Thiohalomonas denitrificans]